MTNFQKALIALLAITIFCYFFTHRYIYYKDELGAYRINIWNSKYQHFFRYKHDESSPEVLKWLDRL